MADHPPPSYTPSAPQIMITPLANRAGWLAGPSSSGGSGAVEGEVWVKGLGLTEDGAKGEGERARVESLTITLTLLDILPGFPDMALFRSEPLTLYASASPHAFATSHVFSISLGNAQAEVARMPGCVHLAGAGEVRYELEAVLRLARGRYGAPEWGVEEVRESQVVHLTPCAPSGAEDTAEMGGTSTAVATRFTTQDDRTTRMRLLLSRRRARIGEAVPVGVEIAVASGNEVHFAASEPGPDTRALRRVKLELHRRVRTPLLSSTEAGPSTSSSSAHPPPDWSTYTSLLWRSGKSCRFSAHQPIRLMFHLPPHGTVHPVAVPAGRGGGVTSGADTTACGEISQETPYHQVGFFVRAIAGYAAGDGPGRTDVDVVLEHELEVIAPSHCLADGVLAPDQGAMATHLAADEALAQRLSFDDSLPDSAEARTEAYRRKGTDVVGAGGTYRPEFPDVIQAGEGSSPAPRRTPYHGAAGGADPPPFSAEVLPPPFAAVAAASREGPQQVHQDPPPLGAATGADLPTFLESQSHSAVGPGARPATDGTATHLTALAATGELASWIEYDGYESFSQPPPPATASLGLSGSMDPPPAGEDAAHSVVDSAVVRELLDGSGAGTSGMQDRIRLMTELGLGDGTRVVDTHEDMPPGIDEPSLPALPDMSRRRSISQSADLDDDVAAVAARNAQAIGISPPSFAASERADAVTDHPPPLYSTSRADAPPSYR